jgi:Ca-activated chloride channel family protein
VNPSADLDAKSLQQIAETTGGRFFRARDTKELSQIYDMLDAIEPAQQDARTFRPVKALFFYPLAVSWALWVGLMLFDARGLSHVRA